MKTIKIYKHNLNRIFFGTLIALTGIYAVLAFQFPKSSNFLFIGCYVIPVIVLFVLTDVLFEIREFGTDEKQEVM